MHKSDVVAIASFIVALGAGLTAGSPLAAALDVVTVGHGQYALSAISLVAFAAGCILRVINNQKPVAADDTKGS